ncbi:unnamed protein product [Leptosia nina]|uniref:Chemosensory protein n=1 Tax=Leptosia nina TaxID=320188 RepID=A0AAV1JV83_9NEOP
MACKLIVLCCVLVAVFADEKYTDKYDGINLQEILDNRRLLLAYANCLLDKGKCSPEGKELKDHVQDALETGCAKCTETQKNGSYTMIEHLINKEKEIWEELSAKYDPEGKYKKQYEEQAKQRAFITADEYTDRYDGINVDEILQNQRLVTSYVKCLLDKGRCTPEGNELKVHIKDGMQTGCSKCTDTQRHQARKVVKFLREHQDNYWKDIVVKYDPKNEFKDVYEAFLASDE